MTDLIGEEVNIGDNVVMLYDKGKLFMFKFIKETKTYLMFESMAGQCRKVLRQSGGVDRQFDDFMKVTNAQYQAFHSM